MFTLTLTLDTPLTSVRIASQQPRAAAHSDVPQSETQNGHRKAGSSDPRVESAAYSFDTVYALLEAINEAICSVEERRQQSLQELRKLAIELSVVVASKLMYQSIELSQFPIGHLVDEALSHLSPVDPQSVTVKLHPEDIALLRKRLEQEQNLTNKLNEMNMQADSSLNRGVCEATIGDAGVMLDLETKVNELRMSLLGTLTDAETERRKTSADGRDVRRFPDRRETA